MFKREFTDNFSRLGKALSEWLEGSTSEPFLDRAIALSLRDNPFFTVYMQRYAIATVARTFLVKEELERWLGNYVVTGSRAERQGAAIIGIIMAGNIPLVGFHDFLCVLASGNRAVVKLSSKDKYLLPAVWEILCRINPAWRGQVLFTGDMEAYVQQYPDKLSALIATGSDTTREAVAGKFTGLPLLLRGRRFSFAVLSGKEKARELQALAKDIFLYYGLGCRNVNYIWVPRGYDPGYLIEKFSGMRTLLALGCYMNIYKRQRAVFTMEGEAFTDGGFFLLKETDDVYPPVSVIGYAEYDSESEILAFEEANKAHIQKKYRTFGLAQAPQIDEYADGVDVMEFLFRHSAHE